VAFDTIPTPERNARCPADGYWRYRVITRSLDEHTASTGDKTAFVEQRRASYGQLNQLTDRELDTPTTGEALTGLAALKYPRSRP